MLFRKVCLFIMAVILVIISGSADTRAVEGRAYVAKPLEPAIVGRAAAVATVAPHPVIPADAAVRQYAAEIPGSAVTEPAGLKIPEQADEENVKITISFAGDCTLGTDPSFPYKGSLPYVLAENNNDFSYFFSGVKEIFSSDDLTLVNLETTLTDASRPAVKKFRFKGNPSYAEILREASIEIVNIANNHTLDYLQKGFDDTLSALKNAGVEYSGREYAPIVCVKGVKVAFIGFTGWDADLRKKIKESIRNAKTAAQVVIVSLHWGQERAYSPGEEQISLAHFCIDNGADAVIGHHPHVLQGVEFYKGRYIAYSLGNFCFGGNSSPSDKDSMIFKNIFEVKQGMLTRVDAEIIPCSISSSKKCNDYRPVLLDGPEKDRVMVKIKRINW